MGKGSKKKQIRKREYEDAWQPVANRKDRPTPERRKKGEWVLLETEDAGIRHAKDVAAHPIDDLERRGVISGDQASAGRDFEALVRAATETDGVRDSCLTWQPKGYASDDGNVEAVRDRRELYLFLGVVRDRMLRRVCVDHVPPRPGQEGVLREALNEAERFFRPRWRAK